MSYGKSKSCDRKDTQDPFVGGIKGSITERLQLLAKGKTTRETAKLWGISGATLNLYLNKGSMPSIDRAISIANAEGVSIEWLALGTSDKKDLKKNEVDNLISIKKYDIAASAGGGSLIDTEDSSSISVSRDWLRQNKLLYSELCIINARGDSMEPSIHDGDELVLKLINECPIKPYDGIYVINIDGLLKVKRLEYNFMSDGYRVMSDNMAYSEEFIPRHEIDDRLQVIGKVAKVISDPLKITESV